MSGDLCLSYRCYRGYRLPHSVRLLCRTDQALVDAYPLRLADGVGFGVRDLLGLERLYAPLIQPLADFLVGDVVG